MACGVILPSFRRRLFAVILVVAVSGLPTPRSAHAQETGTEAPAPITLLVFTRSPYYERLDSGGFGGRVAGPVARALEQAGIAFTWREMEPNGHLRTVEADREPVCAVGWFRTDSREHIGLFSDPVYRDRPQVVLTRADNTGVLRHTSLRGLFADSSLRLGSKLGYAHGPVIDGMIEDLGPPRSTSSQDDAGLVRMMLGGRFDYIITGADEAESLIDAFGEAGQDLLSVTFEDSPPGNTRHLLCSHSVGAARMTRINAALAASREAEE
jgi:polar amino acid transport system substrate-binding protein